MSVTSRLAAALVCLPLLALPLAPALADCVGDFQKAMAPRQALMARLNSYNKKKPTAAQACSTLSSLVAADAKAVAWMTTNKDWCQVPDDSLSQLKTAAGQSVKIRGQVCGVAAKETKLIAQAKRQQQQQAQGGGRTGDPTADLGPSGLPGSPVRLPRGAL